MQFKKTLLATALMSAAAWAPSAHAIPAFARQVGMACSACHYQHFPALNGFGRSFKQNGYTMVGAQEKIEAEGLSIPAVLNAALVGYAQYQKTNGPVGAIGGQTSSTKNTNNGQVQIPQQVSLFLGGRVGEHTGFEAEVSLANGGTVPNAGATATNSGLIRLKVPFVYDVGGVNVGAIPFSTNGLGPADSFEVLNTGSVAVHAFNQTLVAGGTTGGMQVISAQQYLGTATAASGVAFVASNDQFFANFAKWGANTGAGGSGGPTSNYLRAAWTPGDLIPGFDAAVGVQFWKGTTTTSAIVANGVVAATPAANVDTKATAIDAQLLGDVSGMPLTFVFSYAVAPASPAAGTVGNVNLYNAGTQRKKSFNIAAELGVIPNKATLQLGIRRASSGAPVQGGTIAAPVAIANSNATDNAIMFGATYNIALNVRAELTFTKGSGDVYNSVAAGQAAYMGDRMTTVDLAFGF
ncbi:MAG: hypothetical protein K2P57_12725 [Burkholderiales bacterium]|nr:hypothetical protein [Burkholderiales bacterium]